jgi:hypothetical protein
MQSERNSSVERESPDSLEPFHSNVDSSMTREPENHADTMDESE